MRRCRNQKCREPLPWDGQVLQICDGCRYAGRWGAFVAGAAVLIAREIFAWGWWPLLRPFLPWGLDQ